MSPLSRSEKASGKAVKEAMAYLRSCRIKVPKFDLTINADDNWIGGSYVYDGRTLNIGRYPGPYWRRWFAMHELGHVLWATYRPYRRKQFASKFGDEQPADYDRICKKYPLFTPAMMKLSWIAGPHRPKGQPSWYGKLGGGEERFCEMIAFMYANCGNFASPPPADLMALWDTCWEYGLSHMT